MNSFWKGVSLTVVIIMVFIFSYNFFKGNSQPSNDNIIQNQEEYLRQVEIYEQQAKKAMITMARQLVR